MQTEVLGVVVSCQQLPDLDEPSNASRRCGGNPVQVGIVCELSSGRARLLLVCLRDVNGGYKLSGG